MSIYAPPSNIQSVFNPSNYGGLGVDGQITTDYLDANYVQFPVVQGNMTLVGTSILGDVTQQGDLTTTGDITGETIEGTSFLVGTTNLLTEIGTKQDTINDGDLTIAKTDGLQTALDNKYDDTGGTISGSVTITSDLVVGSTNVITEIGTKQDEITTSTDLSCNSLTTTGNIYVEGLILAPNQVSFKASRSTDYTINTSIVLPFDDVIFNNGDGYDDTTYTFTAPVTGIYFFYSQFFTNTNGNYIIDFHLNDVSFYRNERNSSGSGSTTSVSGSFTTQLNSGDEVYLKRSIGAAKLFQHPYSSFGGHLLG